MKYFKNTYPKINELLFENIEGDNFDRLTRWHQVTLKPKCEKLTELMMPKDGQNVTDEQKRKEIETFENLLKILNKQLKNDDEYFSGSDTMCALDIIIHSDVSTIVYMYSLREKLNDKEYPRLSKWMTEMSKNQYIMDNLHKMKEVISNKRMYGDFLKQ